MSSWHFYPKDRFSSYEDYVKYLKEKGFAYDAPEGIYKEEKQMKAPEAPDKICVSPDQIFDYDLEIQEVGHNGAEEYIRKKSLLEKLEKVAAEYKKQSDDGEFVWQRESAWQNMCGINEAINILNKM